MRKDSELFLKKMLEYRNEVGQNTFEINIRYFYEIPSIETAVYDILRDLINNNCLTSKSQVTDLEGNININLTLDGITYFDDVPIKSKESQITFNISDGGQVNIAKDNGEIDTIQNNKYDSRSNDNKKERENVTYGIQQNGISNKIKSQVKVFISYSWVPESNKEWVKNFVLRLENDGIQVVIDFYDLKLGNDKYAFMERIVKDSTIDRVLIICNKEYKKKADSRNGGVGDETEIITPQIYGATEQEKFIPIVNEYDEDGKPYLPNYLSSRMYADLTDFEKGYKELLNNILNKMQEDICDTKVKDSRFIKDKIAASKLFCDLKSIEKYLKKERGNVNIRYNAEWQDLIAKCSFSEDSIRDYLIDIYDEVYNFNYMYERRLNSGRSFRKEDIPAYTNLQVMFFDASKGYVNFKNYNNKYDRIIDKLKNTIESN